MMKEIDEPMTSEPKKRLRERLHFFDNFRSSLILLVIVFHVAISYMSKPPQWWYVIDTQNHPLFDLFVMVTDVFIMPALFLAAGYFALPTLLRKGGGEFWRGKMLRIVLPWIGGVMLFAPLITYMIYFSRTAAPPPYIPYWSEHFFVSADYNQAHYWFLGALSWFFALLTALFYLRPRLFYPSRAPRRPAAYFFALFVLLTGGGFVVGNVFVPADAWFHRLYVFSFQPTRVLLCLAYFFLGVYAWRERWFTSRGYCPNLRTWLPLAALTLGAFIWYRIAFTLAAQPTLPVKIGHGILHAAFCLAATLALLALFQKYVNQSNRYWRNVAANSYVIYYIHQFAVLPLTYLLQKSSLPVAVKYIGVSVSAVLLCWAAANLLRRLLPQSAAAK